MKHSKNPKSPATKTNSKFRIQKSKMEAEFLHPSESEATAASALLLLLLSSTMPPPPLLSSSYYLMIDDDDSNIKKKKTNDSIEFSSPNDSKSCSSSLTTESCCSSEEESRLSILALASHLHDMKLKWQVVRRRRSKHYRISDRRKNLWNECKKPVVLSQVPVPMKQTRSQVSSESSWRIRNEVSSFSSESSSSSSSTTTTTLVSEEMAPGRRMMMRSGLGTISKWEMMRILQKNYRISSGRMRPRAEAILKLLSVGCASEVTIRQVLGDSPDTSKALRILLKLEEVKRSGAGGPKDPFLYTVTGGSGSDAESALSDS